MGSEKMPHKQVLSSNKKKRKHMESSNKHTYTFEQEMDTNFDKVSKKSRGKVKKQQENGEFVDESLTNKIIREAHKQQKEIAEEEEEAGVAKARRAFSTAVDIAHLDSDEDDFDEPVETQSHADLEELDEEDEKLLAQFYTDNPRPQLTLVDLIKKKIENQNGSGQPTPAFGDEVIQIYKGVGQFLSRYTTGKLPKALKVVPSLSNFEEVLYLTEPEKWSPNAMYQVTRTFISNLNAKMAQRFCYLVLLPRIREDINENKRLHFALYQALKKTLYKPQAFFKGILFPLCQSRTCNLREAVIIGSVIQKVSIPSLHSSVGLMKIAEMEYCGTNSYFIKLLLDKKYALPYRVIDAVVEHFKQFLNEERVMPVIWHQSFLTFVQRYKNELLKDQKDDLKTLVQHQKHYLVTPEIIREMNSSRNRGEKEDDAMTDISPVSVINKAIEEDRWNVPAVPMEE